MRCTDCSLHTHPPAHPPVRLSTKHRTAAARHCPTFFSPLSPHDLPAAHEDYWSVEHLGLEVRKGCFIMAMIASCYFMTTIRCPWGGALLPSFNGARLEASVGFDLHFVSQSPSGPLIPRLTLAPRDRTFTSSSNHTTIALESGTSSRQSVESLLGVSHFHRRA